MDQQSNFIFQICPVHACPMPVKTLGVTGSKSQEQSILVGQLPTGLDYVWGSSVKTRQASFLRQGRLRFFGIHTDISLSSFRCSLFPNPDFDTGHRQGCGSRLGCDYAGHTIKSHSSFSAMLSRQLRNNIPHLLFFINNLSDHRSLFLVKLSGCLIAICL